ncbi:MAG: hypothetical protein OXC79_00745 [Candidatus Poribacteria bacterium]|nr:hypothetical protein [Candidatus Poribacteria bacterium]
MKHILFFSILFCTIALPALAELTPQDLDKIRLIINEEIKKESSTTNQKIDRTNEKIDRLDTRIQNVEKDISWVRGKLDGVEKQISHATNVTYGLIALIVVAIGIPAWHGRRDRDQDRKIEELTAEIKTLKQIVNP